MFVRTVIIVLRFRNLLLLVFKTSCFEGNALILNTVYIITEFITCIYLTLFNVPIDPILHAFNII